MLNSIINVGNGRYYQLPDLKKEKVDSTGETIWLTKTWTELFPDREQVQWGLTDRQNIIDEPTWTILTNVYDGFWQRTHSLETFPNWKLKLVLKQNSFNLSYEEIKQYGLEQAFTKWLADYEQLSEDEKNNQADNFRSARETLKIIKKAEQHHQEQQSKRWWRNLFWYGGEGLIILLVLGLIWWKSVPPHSKEKNKKSSS